MAAPGISISIGPDGLTIGGLSSATHLREGKGKSLLESLDTYVAIDIETTGLDPSWDEIIELGAVRVQNGTAVEEFQSLVKPNNPIDTFITELTGITNEMLAGALSIEAALPSFIDFVDDQPIIAHNANFDVNFIYDACTSLNPKVVFSNSFVDTMRLSRRLYKDQRHHRLCDLAERFGFDNSVEHRALSDISKMIACYEHMKEYASANGINMNTLYPQRSGLRAANIMATTTDFDETTSVYGKVFCFTGALQKMVRKDAMQIVVNLGGQCGDGVTKDTNYLVLGNNDYCASIKDGKSSKHKKAEKYKANGMDIEIISENVFCEMLAEAGDA